MFNLLRLAIVGVAVSHVDVASAQNFVFQREAVELTASANCTADIAGEFDPDNDLDTSDGDLVYATAASDHSMLGSRLRQTAIAQSGLNADNQVITQAILSMEAIGDADFPDELYEIFGGSVASGSADVEAEFTQLVGSGGSDDVVFVVEAQGGTVIDTADLYNPGVSVPRFSASLTINEAPVMSIEADANGAVWLTDSSGTTQIGDFSDGTFSYESLSFTLHDGDKVLFHADASSRAVTFIFPPTPAYDAAISSCDVSVSLEAIP